MQSEEKAKWTFMVYLAGDNNLDSAGIGDLQEMMEVGSTDDVNIVAEFDRRGQDGHTKRYHVKKDELTEIDDIGETDSGDPGVLLRFVCWARDKYPADRYALVLWNHGGGWAPTEMDHIAEKVGSKDYGKAEGVERSSSNLGRVFFRPTLETILSLDLPSERAICSDDGSGHSLDTVELGKVLTTIAELLGQPLDLLGMDACLMSNLEVAYEAWPNVRYIVASEENEPNNGWPYNDVLAKLVAEPDLETVDLGAHIVKAYVDSYATTHFTVTQAVVDLSKLDAIVGPMDELALALIDHMPTAADEMWSAQRASARFHRNTLWDINDFCGQLESRTSSESVKSAAQDVRSALQQGAGNYIVAEAHRGGTVERCGGVTVYLLPPLDPISRYYGDLRYAQEHQWEKTLRAYYEPPV
ncbi:MAG: clostripain-related cysteine peptidase [Anaerolineae bacterium]